MGGLNTARLPANLQGVFRLCNGLVSKESAELHQLWVETNVWSINGVDD